MPATATPDLSASSRVTWKAVVGLRDPDDVFSGFEVLIRENTPGVSDLVLEQTWQPTDLAAAERWLTEQGFDVSEPWQFVRGFEGLRLYAALTKRDDDRS